jgi:putative membrane protein
MIGIGLTALVLATVEHRRNMEALRKEYGHLVSYSLATLVAGLIGLLGVLGLLAVGFRY